MPRLQRSNSKTKHHAVELRKESTPAERKLWSRLRNNQLGVNFRRQHAIGSYIPDFCSPKAKLIIELGGSQHLEQEEYQYFTKVKRIPENKGAGVRPPPYFRASTSYFVIY